MIWLNRLAFYGFGDAKTLGKKLPVAKRKITLLPRSAAVKKTEKLLRVFKNPEDFS